MVTGGAVCSNWACTESVRGEVSDGLPYLDGGNMIKTTEDLVRIIRICGEAVTSNAESIAGDFKYQTACNINV